MRVLIVDDCCDTADTVQEILQDWGHEARAVYSGPQALELIAGFSPQVILCDLAMPGMHGFAFCAALKDHPEARETRLIAVSGYSDQAMRERCEDAGFERHLQKPVDFEELQRSLEG